MSYNYKVKPVKSDPLPLPKHIQEKIGAYDHAGLIYIRDAMDDQEISFLDLVTRRPATHKRYITYLMRLKTQKRFVVGGETDEALVYHTTEEVQNHMDLYVALDRERGFWWNKNTRMVRNVQGQSATPQVLGDVPVFTIPFSPEMVDTIMGFSEIGVQQFYVGTAATAGPNITTGDQYTIKNKQDFQNGTFEELMDMGRYNYSTKESRLGMWRGEGETIKKQSQTISSLTQKGQRG